MLNESQKDEQINRLAEAAIRLMDSIANYFSVKTDTEIAIAKNWEAKTERGH